MHRTWKFLFAATLLLFMPGGAGYLRADSSTGWMADRGHPEVQYRLKCDQGALTIDWKNSYPGDVTLRFRVRGSSYDGEEDIAIPAGGSATSNPDTLYCAASAFEVTEKRFNMAPPVRSAAPNQPDKPKSAPPIPTVAPWVPPAKLAELPQDRVAMIHAGMKRAQLVQLIGDPTSKVSIPDDNDLLEIYRYPVSTGRAATIRLSNGIVTQVDISQP